MTNKLLLAGTIVTGFSRKLRSAGMDMTSIPACVIQVVKEGFWKERIDSQTGRNERFETFVEFVETPPTRGLGSTIAMLQDLCRSNPEATKSIDDALRRGAGNPIGTNQYTAEERKGTVDNVHVSSQPPERPNGNARNAGMRKLERHAPKQLELVLRGEVSVHRALIDAGLRVEPTPLDKIRSLYRKLSKDDRRAFLDEVLK